MQGGGRQFSVRLYAGKASRDTGGQTEVDAADKVVEDAKRRSDGYGQPLIDATRQRKEAQEKVARIMDNAMSGDPNVASSRRDLAAAEELRQANAAAAQEK